MRKVRRKDGRGGVKGRREGGERKREEERGRRECKRMGEKNGEGGEQKRKGEVALKRLCGESKLKEKVLTLRNLVLAELAASLKSPSVSIQLSLMAEMHSSTTTAISHLYARR